MREERHPRLLRSELANRAKVQPSTITRLETNSTAEPTTLAKVAKALDVRLSTLYRLAGYPGFVDDAHHASIIGASLS